LVNDDLYNRPAEHWDGCRYNLFVYRNSHGNANLHKDFLNMRKTLLISATLYGALSGSDVSNNCQSQGSPCTIQGAINAALGIGGAVIQNNGTVITVSPAGQVSVNGALH
jgi:hypothetical protein